jgi:hypothetical protein
VKKREALNGQTTHLGRMIELNEAGGDGTHDRQDVTCWTELFERLGSSFDARESRPTLALGVCSLLHRALLSSEGRFFT